MKIQFLYLDWYLHQAGMEPVKVKAKSVAESFKNSYHTKVIDLNFQQNREIIHFNH